MIFGQCLMDSLVVPGTAVSPASSINSFLTLKQMT